MRLLIVFLGSCTAFLPSRVVDWICRGLGLVLYRCFTRRRRVILSNLKHAFPEKSNQELKKIAIKSCQRTIELGALAIELPFFSRKEIQKHFLVDDSLKKFVQQFNKNPQPCIILVPHFSQMEAATVIPAIIPSLNPKDIGILYRPFKNPSIEKWVKSTRERFGMRLLSRRSGLLEAKNILSQRKILVLLFDQNAGESGILSTFFSQPVSSTPLPQLLQSHFRCQVFVLWPQRLGFFRSRCSIEPLNFQHSSDGITTAMNQWLENKLSQNNNITADWLWVHNRWKFKHTANLWLNLTHKKTISFLNFPQKRTSILIRLPDAEPLFLAALPLIQLIAKARPDASISVLLHPQWAKNPSIPPHFTIIPNTFSNLIKCRHRYFRFHVSFEDSRKSDREALIIGALYRFGITYNSKSKSSFIQKVYVREQPSPAQTYFEFLKNMGLH